MRYKIFLHHFINIFRIMRVLIRNGTTFLSCRYHKCPNPHHHLLLPSRHPSYNRLLTIHMIYLHHFNQTFKIIQGLTRQSSHHITTQSLTQSLRICPHSCSTLVAMKLSSTNHLSMIIRLMLLLNRRMQS